MDSMDVHPKYPKLLPAQLRRGWCVSRKINKIYSEVLSKELTDKLLSVEGHITPRQCATLFYFAYTQPGPGTIVEIGSFKGKSTVWMAQALKERAETIKIAAVDPHINTREKEIVPNYKEESSYDAFIKNVSSLEVNEWVLTIKKTSEEAAKDFNQAIRLLFIDGSHRYEDALLDLELWEPMVNVGGIIVMHDTKPTGPFPGVCRAKNEYLKNSPRFKEVIQLLNLTVFKKIS